MRTRVVIPLALLLVILTAANLLPSHAQKASEPQVSAPPPLSNPLKVALLKWYQANTVPTTVQVGSQPYGVAFDGANIWTANYMSNTVSKVQANDGTVLGTFNVGAAPIGLAFDGANIWVTNSADNNVMKLRASDGKNQGTFNTGQMPFWPAFDGGNVWIPNYLDGTVTKLRASDGKVLGTFSTGANVAVTAAAFDGANIWITNYGGGGNGTVSKLRASDGTILGKFTVGPNPLGVAFDGAYIWVANQGGASVSKLRPSDGAAIGTFNVPIEPYGVAFDGANIWVTNFYGVTELRAQTERSSAGTEARTPSASLSMGQMYGWQRCPMGFYSSYEKQLKISEKSSSVGRSPRGRANPSTLQHQGNANADTLQTGLFFHNNPAYWNHVVGSNSYEYIYLGRFAMNTVKGQLMQYQVEASCSVVAKALYFLNATATPSLIGRIVVNNSGEL